MQIELNYCWFQNYVVYRKSISVCYIFIFYIQIQYILANPDNSYSDIHMHVLKSGFSYQKFDQRIYTIRRRALLIVPYKLYGHRFKIYSSAFHLFCLNFPEVTIKPFTVSFRSFCGQ